MKKGDTVLCIKDYKDKKYHSPRTPKAGDIATIEKVVLPGCIVLKEFKFTTNMLGWSVDYWKVINDNRVSINIKLPKHENR